MGRTAGKHDAGKGVPRVVHVVRVRCNGEYVDARIARFRPCLKPNAEFGHARKSGGTVRSVCSGFEIGAVEAAVNFPATRRSCRLCFARRRNSSAAVSSKSCRGAPSARSRLFPARGSSAAPRTGSGQRSRRQTCAADIVRYVRLSRSATTCKLFSAYVSDRDDSDESIEPRL